MNEPIEQFTNALNTMTRQWWNLFNEIEKAIDRGEVAHARFICSKAKESLKIVLKENGNENQSR